MDEKDREAALREAFARFGELVFAKDFAVIETFAPDAVFIGSEADEVAHGLEEVRARIETVFASDHAIRFEWDRLQVVSKGDTGWVTAFGSAVIVDRHGNRRLPYRLTGVFGWHDGAWRWHQFHGSEPA